MSQCPAAEADGHADDHAVAALAKTEQPNIVMIFTDEWRTDVYYDHPYGHGGAIPRTIGVRNNRYTYTRYIDPTPAFEQLFDMHLGPNQRVNLAEDPAFAELLEQMRQRCDELKQEVGPVAAAE